MAFALFMFLAISLFGFMSEVDRHEAFPLHSPTATIATNDNINEASLKKAHLACPCPCASQDDLRKAIAAYLAEEASAGTRRRNVPLHCVEVG